MVDFGVPNNHRSIILRLKFRTEKIKFIVTTTSIDWNMLLDEDNLEIISKRFTIFTIEKCVLIEKR